MMNLYQIVTDKIIEQLEAGTIPWQKPWFAVHGGAYNAVTGHAYSLMNQMLLPKSGEWASYNQWLRVGGQVKQGEKSSLVVFWRWQQEPDDIPEEEAQGDAENKTKKPILKYYHVFHISQVDGVDPLVPTDAAVNPVEPIARAEELLAGYLNREQVRLETEYSDKACYSPATDTIHLPVMGQFQNAAMYYSTAFHEASHSTGAKHRLNRKGLQSVRFGSESYSKEELIAELSAASILHMLGIDTEQSFQNSAAYISGWFDVLNRDKRFVVSAAGQAEKAARLITGGMLLRDAAEAADA